MIFKVVPLRRQGGWRLTDTHRAEAWGIASFRRGHPMRVLLRCKTKALAEDQLGATQRAYEGVSRYALGKRMGKKELHNA